MKKLLFFVSIFVFICSFGALSIAAIKTSKASGNWSTSTTWTDNSIPGAGDTVIIQYRHNVNVTAAPSNIPGAVSVNAGGTLTISKNVVFPIIGDISSAPPTFGSFGGNGTLATGRGAVAINLTGNWIFTGTSRGTGLVVNCNGAGEQTIGGNANVNLTINKPSGKVRLLNHKTFRTFIMKSGTFDPNNFVTRISRFIFRGGTLIVNTPTWTGNYSANPTPSAGTTIEYTYSNPVINGRITYYNLTFSGTGTTEVPSRNLTIRGNLVNTGGGVLNFGSRNITFSGSAPLQNIAGFTTTGTVSCMKTGGTVLLTGNVSSDRLFISGNGTLDLGNDQVHTFSNLFLLRGTLKASSSILNISGTANSRGTFVAGSGTVNYSGSDDQTLAAWTYNNLILSGSGVKTIPAITVNGILSMEGTATASAVPTYCASATLRYKGSAQQTTGPELPSIMAANVTIDNPNGVVLNAPATINGILTFTAGNLSLGANNLTLGGSVIGAAAAQCIVINGTGSVVRQIVPSASGLFPIGPSTAQYNPVTLTADAGHTADNFTISVASGAVNPAVTDNNQALQVTWNIAEEVVGGSSVSVELGWNSSQHGTTFSNSIASIWRYDEGSSVWQDLSGGVVQGTDHYTLSTPAPVTSFSTFCIGNAGALPVEMTSFTATSNNRTAHLRWSTATEVNSYNFEIERRRPGTSEYVKVGTVQAAGVSNVTRSYEFTDANVTPGRHIYRLKMNDNDGSYSYSGNIELSIGGQVPEGLSLRGNYPNPFNPSTTIEFTVPESGHVTLKVYNVIGQHVATLFDAMVQADQYQVKFDASQLASGIYFSVMEFGNQRFVKKMMLTK